MQTFGTYIILIGMAVATLAQIAGAILVLRSSVAKGVLSLLVPGYLLFALRRQGIYKQIVGTWVLGILGLAVGTILLS